MKKKTKQFEWKLILLAVVIILAVLLFPTIVSFFDNLEKFIENAGTFGPIVFMLAMIVGILVSPIPTVPLAVIGGALFGPWLGLIYTIVSATVGAILAFYVGRFFFKDFLQRKFEKTSLYKKMAKSDGKKLASIVFLTRMMPQVSFDFVSYIAGVTHMRVSHFAIATFLGMIPIVFLLTFFGHLLQPFTTLLLAILFVVFLVYLIRYLFLARKKK